MTLGEYVENAMMMKQKQKTKNFSTRSCFYFLCHIRLLSKKGGMYIYMGYFTY